MYSRICRRFGCYHPQRSWGKVIFLHVSVILFTGGGCLHPGGLFPGEGLCPLGGSLSRGVCLGGVSVMGTPSYGNERAVRILLECILVLCEITDRC